MGDQAPRTEPRPSPDDRSASSAGLRNGSRTDRGGGIGVVGSEWWGAEYVRCVGDTIRYAVIGSGMMGSGVREVPAPMDPCVPYPAFHQGASFMEHLAFADAICAGRPASVTVTEGMWAVATGAAAHRSIDERRPVDLSEFDLR